MNIPEGVNIPNINFVKEKSLIFLLISNFLKLVYKNNNFMTNFYSQVVLYFKIYGIIGLYKPQKMVLKNIYIGVKTLIKSHGFKNFKKI